MSLGDDSVIFRPIHTIAAEILDDWKNPSVYAKPYIEVMLRLDSIRDTYIAEDARSVLLYFLNNAKGWRGSKARAIKDEIRAMIRSTGYSI